VKVVANAEPKQKNEGEHNRKKDDTKNIKYVKTVKVNNDTVQVVVEGYGRVRSATNLTLTSEAQGKLLEGAIPFKQGQTFTKGTLLCKIDNTEALMQHQAKKATFIKSVANVLPEIKIDFSDKFSEWDNFYKSLDPKKSLPEIPQSNNVKLKTFLASKNILSEYYNLKSEEVKLSKYNIYAPFNGSIKTVKQEIGSYVNPGTPLADLIQSTQMEIPIPIEIDDLPLVKAGQKAIVYSENKMQKWDAVVTRVADFVDENTQTLDVFIRLTPQKNQPIFNGMYVTAKIFSSQVPNAVEIPRRALNSNESLYFVNLSDSSIYVKNIETDSIKVVKWNKKTMVLKGLENGSLLIIEPLTGISKSTKYVPLNAQNN
jgi:multidrug efflux pump subunit AcrA (membrane-fusion protein)